MNPLLTPRTPSPIAIFSPPKTYGFRRQLAALLFVTFGLPALLLPTTALPIGPDALAGEGEKSLPRATLKPEAFQIDLLRLGLQNGLGSHLVRINETLAPSIRNAALAEAMLQLQEIQSHEPGNERADVPEDAPVPLPGSPSAAPYNQPAPPLAQSRHGSPSWQIGGNANADGNPFIGPTNPNGAPHLHAGAQGQSILRLEATAVAPNVLGGYPGNLRGDTVGGATISGGGVQGEPNNVTTDFSTVGGGSGNQAGGDPRFIDSPHATVSGGRNNLAGRRHATVGGGINNRVTAHAATIAGGSGNRASGDYSLTVGGRENSASARFAFVGGGDTNAAPGELSAVLGGQGNTADGIGAAIGGGVGNRASGTHATIPGGRNNEASGSGSFAAGNQARALHEGSIVFADAAKAPFASSGPNQFIIRATSGVGIGTPNPTEQLTVAGNIAPATDDTHSLGSNDRRWREIKLSGGIDTVGNFVISDRGSPRLLLDDQGNLKVAGKVIMDAFGGPGALPPSVQALRATGDARLARLENRLQELESRPAAKPEIPPNATTPMRMDQISREQQRLLTQLETLSLEFAALKKAPPPSTRPTPPSRPVAAPPQTANTWQRTIPRRNMEIQGEVDPNAILQRLATVPVHAYTEAKSTDLRLGPSADEFNRAMGFVGDQDDLDTGSVDGVLIAAVQELATRLSALEAENTDLKTRIDVLERR